MNITQLLQAQKEALELVARIEAQIEEANSDESTLVREMLEIDDQFAELATKRIAIETKLAKLRLHTMSVELMGVREASLATGYTEESIRTLANPKRTKGIKLDKTDGYGTRIIVSTLKAYVDQRALYKGNA